MNRSNVTRMLVLLLILVAAGRMLSTRDTAPHHWQGAARLTIGSVALGLEVMANFSRD